MSMVEQLLTIEDYTEEYRCLRSEEQFAPTHQLNGMGVDVARNDREGREGASHLDYTSSRAQRVDV